jgi:hypothetical protein
MHATPSPQPAPPVRIGRALARWLGAARSRRTRGAVVPGDSPHPPNDVATSDCTTFIRIWIDAEALRPGSTDGIHIADNRSADGSRHQGTPVLSTCVKAGSPICWEIFNISPASDAILRIEAISASPLFAHGAPPRTAPDNVDARTTIAVHPGRDTYTVAFGVTCPGRPPMRFRISPSLSVLEHTA